MSASRRVSPSPRPSPRPGSSGGLSIKDELEMDKIEDEMRRPSSANSRHAWNDNDGFDMGTEEREVHSSFAQREYDDDEDEDDDSEDSDGDHAPTAMENEVYVGGQIRAIDPKIAKAKAEEQRASCWVKIGRGIRSLWRTRQTEDTSLDKELHVKTTLRELAIYLVFLVVICIVTFGMTSSHMYYYTKVMSELFLDTQFPDTKNTFRGMTTMHDFWRFAETPLMDGLYWEKWYNNENVTDDELGYIFYENKLLGVPRIRQLKVTNDSCQVHTDFEDNINTCYAGYSESLEDTATFGLNNGTAWVYSTEEDLDGSGHTGMITSYGGGGFYADLMKTKAESLDIILTLKENLWLDRGTRALFVDFTVYNANINYFCIIRLTVEYPPTGGAIPSYKFRTVKLLRYVTAFDYFILACEGIFCLYIMYYMVEEILEIKRHRWAYFKSSWNCLDVIIIMISVVCVAFSVYRYLTVANLIEGLLAEPDIYPDFEYMGYWQDLFNNIIAVNVFLAWIKTFKYISFNKTMTQLSSTLSRCAKDVGGFTVMFAIIFMAYAQLGYLVFGTQIKDFSSIGSCIYTLFRIVLGDFNFHELEAANRFMGPIFFLTYVFVVFFVLLNMFLAIINDTYSEVKSDIALQKSEFEITDYFKKGYEKMVGKINFKRDKIADIQEALAHADANADQHLDFDEWRQELKCRGHADADIEAVFAKYDVDGDRVLDAEEQMKMAHDLEGQKSDLNNQLAELEDAKGKHRPTTARSRVSINDEDDDDDDEEGGGRRRGGGGGGGVAYEEFVVLSRRVDRMEHSIGSIVSKIDAVLVKLEAMERAKLKRRETMGKLLDSITEEREIKMAYKEGTGGLPRSTSSASQYSEMDEEDEDEQGNVDKREKMEKLVREELERWDSEASLSQASRRAGSSASNRPGSNQRSRPDSSASRQVGLDHNISTSNV
ncbi:polycystic kidney disease protein 2 isoform X3 [Strongylocentrotus purpuratus]|uniref:EF-hand domain-containing protein n=1 Tax=Strongylocentrotus purpuratus TaxID=7668 RepID=A0A7M7SW59_STRPU|nr:polycystic kidney disease protein 2 isoform X3 [Strongylocentrotus purpuratus]